MISIQYDFKFTDLWYRIRLLNIDYDFINGPIVINNYCMDENWKIFKSQNVVARNGREKFPLHCRCTLIPCNVLCKKEIFYSKLGGYFLKVIKHE